MTPQLLQNTTPIIFLSVGTYIRGTNNKSAWKTNELNLSETHRFTFLYCEKSLFVECCSQRVKSEQINKTCRVGDNNT